MLVNQYFTVLFDIWPTLVVATTIGLWLKVA